MPPHAWQAPDADRIVDGAIAGIRTDLDRLAVPGLAGVVLGGGYGRGEGGVKPDGTLSNDLDFFAIAAEGATDRDAARLARALAPLAADWTERLGIDVDFTAKTPFRLRHDAERLMVQELLRGHVDAWGAPGADLFAGIPLRDAGELPWTEAVRLLANRGMGLLFAREAGRGPDFTARNITKAVLGAGDARLIARHAYRWRAGDRREALADSLYARALDWKFRPVAAPPCPWDQARACWLSAASEIHAAARPRRRLRDLARWFARRRTPGPLRTLALDPVFRLFDEIADILQSPSPKTTPSLLRDWQTFG